MYNFYTDHVCFHHCLDRVCEWSICPKLPILKRYFVTNKILTYVYKLKYNFLNKSKNSEAVIYLFLLITCNIWFKPP